MLENVLPKRPNFFIVALIVSASSGKVSATAGQRTHRSLPLFFSATFPSTRTNFPPRSASLAIVFFSLILFASASTSKKSAYFSSPEINFTSPFFSQNDATDSSKSATSKISILSSFKTTLSPNRRRSPLRCASSRTKATSIQYSSAAQC